VLLQNAAEEIDFKVELALIVGPDKGLPVEVDSEPSKAGLPWLAMNSPPRCE